MHTPTATPRDSRGTSTPESPSSSCSSARVSPPGAADAPVATADAVRPIAIPHAAAPPLQAGCGSPVGAVRGLTSREQTPMAAVYRMPSRRQPPPPLAQPPARQPAMGSPQVQQVSCTASSMAGAKSCTHIIGLGGPRQALNGEKVQILHYMGGSVDRWRVQRTDGEILLLRAANLESMAELTSWAGVHGTIHTGTASVTTRL